MRLRPNRYHVRHDSAQCAAETLDVYPRWAECGAGGTYARRSTVASRSSPAAAQRCAEGAGLDGGDRGRSTITCAVHRTRCSLNSTGAEVPMNAFDTSPIYTSLTDATTGGWRRGRLRRCGRGGSGRLLPLQRIGLRLPLGCDLPQAALQLVADRQITGKRPSVLRLRSKLRRGLGRRWFFRHGGGTHSQAEELHLRPSQTNLDRIGHDGRREQEKVRTRPAWQI
jgi:hypothetical protein